MLVVAFALSLTGAAVATEACAGPRSGGGAQLPEEKASRTSAQKKISSQLLFEIDRRRGDGTPRGVPSPGSRPGLGAVKIDGEERALVDVRAAVVPGLHKAILDFGSVIVSSSAEYRSTIAWIPLLKLEQLAEDPAVIAIQPAAEPQLQRPDSPPS